MIAHLIRKEFLDSLLNQRFVILAVFSIILMPLSGFINNEYYEARKASFDSQFNTFNENELATPMRAYRAPVILSSLAQGIEPFMPIYFAYNNTAVFTNEDASSPGNIEAQDYSMLSTFGNFDFLFLVLVVFSLLAILLSFDMISGEKERGTLKAVLANSLPRDSIIISKFIGGYAVLWFTFFLGFLLLYLVLIVQNSQYLEAETLSRVGFIFLGSSFFLASLYSIGLMISSFCHTSRTSIVILLVCWVVLLLVIPKAGELLAQVIRPVPAQHELRVERKRVIQEEQSAMAVAAGTMYTELTGNEYVSLSRDAPWMPEFKRKYADLFTETQQRQNNRLRDITFAWERKYNAQQSLGNAIALLSPATALSFLVSDAAGTGNLAYQKYKRAVDEQYQIVDREIFSKQQSGTIRINTGNSSASMTDTPEEADLASIPQFIVREPSISEVVDKNIWGIAIISIYLILPLAVTYIRFLSYDVR